VEALSENADDYYALAESVGFDYGGCSTNTAARWPGPPPTRNGPSPEDAVSFCLATPSGKQLKQPGTAGDRRRRGIAAGD
jgi:hypothetical protein